MSAYSDWKSGAIKQGKMNITLIEKMNTLTVIVSMAKMMMRIVWIDT